MKAFENFDFLHDFIDEKRYCHTVNVAKWAEKLAQLYGADPEKCRTAGYLHDILKQKDVLFLLQWCEGFDIIQEINEQNARALLHGPAASRFVQSELGVDDEEIINAIAYHTTGRPGMSKIEKIVFLADMIGEDRDYDGVEQLRKLALQDLDQAVFSAVCQNLHHLVNTNRAIALDTVRTYNDFINQTNQAKE